MWLMWGKDATLVVIGSALGIGVAMDMQRGLHGTRTHSSSRDSGGRQPQGAGRAGRRFQSCAANPAAPPILGPGGDAAVAGGARSVIDLFEAARQLEVFCDRQGWRSCFIGGIAVQRWGEPRVTLDVD